MYSELKKQIALKLGGGLSKTIFKNSSLNAFRTVILSFLSFVTIPVILNKLGTENYGVWALVIAFGSYANFLELGFNSAVTRLVASANAKATADKQGLINNEIADQINSTVITYILISAVIFVSVLLFYPLFKNLMFRNIFVSNLDLFVLGTLFLNLTNLVTSNYLSVLTGKMRMDLTNAIIIFTNLLQTTITIVMLYMGYGLLSVFAGSAISGVFSSALPVILAKREMPELFLDFSKYNFSKIKHLFKFSLKMYFINSVSNFLSATNKFIIVRLTGLDFVAYYEIANKVVFQLRILFQNVLEPVYPAASMVVGSRENENVVTEQCSVTTNNNMKIVNAYNKAFKYLLGISFIGYGAMFVVSYPVFLLWLGKEYANVSLITIIIGVGSMFNLQTAIPFFFLSALNRLKLALWSAILVVGCNFVFGFLGNYFFGFYGLISGFTLAMILPSIWFVGVGRREVLGIDF